MRGLSGKAGDGIPQKKPGTAPAVLGPAGARPTIGPLSTKGTEREGFFCFLQFSGTKSFIRPAGKALRNCVPFLNFWKPGGLARPPEETRFSKRPLQEFFTIQQGAGPWDLASVIIFRFWPNPARGL